MADGGIAMIRQEFICDKKGCPSKAGAERGSVWLELAHYDGAHQFCSTNCLRDWLMALQPAPDPNKGVVFTCDDCGKEILMRPGDEWPAWCEIKREEQGAVRLGFCSNSCLVLWVGIYADNHFTDTLSKKFLAEHRARP